MRIPLKWGFFVFVIGWMAYFTLGFIDKVQHKKAVSERIQTLPEFTFQTSGGKFTSNNLLEKATIIVYFDPTCEHCQQEAKAFRQQAGQLKDAQVLWLSSEPIEQIQRFGKENGLAAIPSVTVAHITKETAHETFGFTTVPSILIYDAEGRFVKQYKGETKMEALTSYL